MTSVMTATRRRRPPRERARESLGPGQPPCGTRRVGGNRGLGGHPRGEGLAGPLGRRPGATPRGGQDPIDPAFRVILSCDWPGWNCDPKLDGTMVRLAAETDSAKRMAIWREVRLRRPRSDGSTALRLDPLERLERLTSLVPAPGRPWLSNHAVLAPLAAWRAALGPPPPAQDDAGPANSARR